MQRDTKDAKHQGDHEETKKSEGHEVGRVSRRGEGVRGEDRPETPMKEQLIVDNFGPIRRAEIEVRNLTVFVGPQATGKSMTAQALYFVRGIETLFTKPTDSFLDRTKPRFVTGVTPPASDEDLALADTVSGLEWWFGNDASVFASKGTVLRWNPDAPCSETECGLHWDERGAHLNKVLEARVLGRSSFPPLSQTYIPAGRALYSYLHAGAVLSMLSRDRDRFRWPGHVVTFYETLGESIRDLAQLQGQPTPQGSQIDRFLRSRIESVVKGKLQYGYDTVSLKVDDRKTLRPETIAAGQMEIWPFWVVVEENILRGGLKHTRIHFEEPEAHLHPAAQRTIVEIIAYLVNQGGQFVITTHSPYILYAINNALMARKVLDAGKHLPRDVRKVTALRPEHVAAYRFDAKGKAHNIMDREVGLINEHELDRVADKLGATFTRLQERMEGLA